MFANSFEKHAVIVFQRNSNLPHSLNLTAQIIVLRHTSKCVDILPTNTSELLGACSISYLDFTIQRFFVVFSETRVNTGQESLRKTPHGGHSFYRHRSLARQSALIPTTNQPKNNYYSLVYLCVNSFIIYLLLSIILKNC